MVDVNIITDYCEGPELGECVDQEVEVDGDQEALVLRVLLLQMSGDIRGLPLTLLDEELAHKWIQNEHHPY